VSTTAILVETIPADALDANPGAMRAAPTPIIIEAADVVAAACVETTSTTPEDAVRAAQKSRP
jgi:hypothetical protein